MLDLEVDRVINASVVWLDAEALSSCTRMDRRNRVLHANSHDLIHWIVGGIDITVPGEDPRVFRWKGCH